MLNEATDANFEEIINADKVLVDCWAPWCGPCHIIGPRYENLSKKMKDIKFYKLNVDENQATSAKYGIRSIPTILAFKNGEKVGEIVGAMPEDMLRERIEQAFS